jgi:hypothetical protein
MPNLPDHPERVSTAPGSSKRCTCTPGGFVCIQTCPVHGPASERSTCPECGSDNPTKRYQSGRTGKPCRFSFHDQPAPADSSNVAERGERAYCLACGEYMPKTLDGSRCVHECDRTPPLDGLPPNIYACPICGGHAARRYGCWGTEQRPHAHAYMQPVHELARTASQATERGSDGD